MTTTPPDVLADQLADSVITVPLAPERLRQLDAQWRAANYLSVGQIYLMDNPFCARNCGPNTSKGNPAAGQGLSDL